MKKELGSDSSIIEVESSKKPFCLDSHRAVSEGYQPMKIGKTVSITPWLNIEYALSRKMTLTAGWARQWGFEEINRTTPDLSKEMTTWNLTARFYSNTDFAPLGPYWGAGLHWVHFTNMSDGSSGGNTFGLHVSLGRNYVFLQRMLLNIEVRYAYTNGISEYFKISEYDGKPRHRVDAALANIMMLRLGLGILPF